MNKEIDIVFALLRGALGGAKPDLQRLEANEWWSLFRLLQQNHVAALASEIVRQLAEPLQPPREVKIPWLSERQKAENWYRHQCEVQSNVIELMQRNGIKTLVLKGTHLAKLYPLEALREFGDIDLYFYDRHDEADALAARELKVAIFNFAHHHTKYDFRGVTVESHYDFINAHTPPSNKQYEKRLKELAPSPMFELLFLLRHMAGHFASNRITLRDLCDWHLLTTALAGKVDWSSIEHQAEESGMAEFLHIVNTIARQRLGNNAVPDTACDRATMRRVEQNIVYGDCSLRQEYGEEDLGRLWWKLRRYRVNQWKRRLVYRHDSAVALLISSLTAHAMKPQSILHKM